MPGLDLSLVSSNWKILQGRLNAGKKAEAQSDGVKRKRAEEKKAFTGFKKTKLSGTNTDTLGKRRKMGNGESKPAGNGSATHDRARLVREHGIAPEDVSAAYGSSAGSIRRQDDEINGGLHPTHKAGKYIALDCEMVGTGPPPHSDNVLARASIVNFHGEQIYDAYVLPPKGVRVEDYRTHVSGIKPSHLAEGYARPFAQVQRDVAELLKDRILVGHALRNDLQALLLSHSKRDLRDTSRHPKFRIDSKGKPPALRNLTKSELGITIQTGEHSSIEDARAAMMLFKKEKAGFEDENRRQFGQHRRFDKDAVKAQAKQAAGDDDEVEHDEDEDEEDDMELLDGEDDGLEGGAEGNAGSKAAGLKAKKKRKKKKRTKRT
ncbi:hypothetical protein LTR36_003811 [Oleoguttula mirabilis]|uniref:RNA exonuclease 4 n=1 Tax=Oleoguttula mirabilis TaxID=1507867 RepID=A0AAV9JI20_9PEZI|nr:hypothetical protein LTR36_003811 [Oleoguttula mirabilis]